MAEGCLNGGPLPGADNGDGDGLPVIWPGPLAISVTLVVSPLVEDKAAALGCCIPPAMGQGACLCGGGHGGCFLPVGGQAVCLPCEAPRWLGARQGLQVI